MLDRQRDEAFGGLLGEPLVPGAAGPAQEDHDAQPVLDAEAEELLEIRW